LPVFEPQLAALAAGEQMAVPAHCLGLLIGRAGLNLPGQNRQVEPAQPMAQQPADPVGQAVGIIDPAEGYRTFE
jgi:hypothetical protein